MTRQLQIESCGDYFYKRVFPAIRLKGQWLQQAGFHPGARVQVTQVQSGVLELRVCGPVPLTADAFDVIQRLDAALSHVDALDSQKDFSGACRRKPRVNLKQKTT